MNRDSNVELLRVVLMFLIVMGHFSQFGYFEDKPVSMNSLNLESIFFIQIRQFARPACATFGIISGYYQIGGYSLNKLYPIIVKTELYSIVFMLITYTFNLAPLSLSECALGFVPIIFGNWYIVTYIILFPLIPYANKLIHELSQQQFKKFIITIAIIFCIIPTFTLNVSFSSRFGTIGILMFTYFIGAYIRLHGYPRTRIFWNVMTVVGFVTMIIINLSILAVGYTIKSDRIISNSMRLSECNTIPAMIFSIGIFVTFLELKVHGDKISKLINIIGKSTFGVYLIHINSAARLWVYCKPFYYFNSNSMPYLGAFLQIIIVFAFCSIIDCFYEVTIGKILKTHFAKKQIKRS